MEINDPAVPVLNRNHLPAALNIVSIAPKLLTLSAEKKKVNPIKYSPLLNSIEELL